MIDNNCNQVETAKRVDVLVFHPREILDLKPMRELPERELAALMAIPAHILNLGYDQTKPKE